MAVERIRKDDTVIVIAGRERGKTGKVLRLLPEKNRVVIERVNMVKRHQKPRGVQSPGGIVEKEAPIHLSNVLPICGRCNKPARVGRRRLDSAVQELTAISGQKPVVTKAKKAIANFKLREGTAIGAMVTLRGDRMYEFFERLVGAALPRVRDFKGVPDRAFDGRGNYSLGIREQIIFPEINLDKVDKIKGLTVVICTTARSDAEG